MQIVLSEEKLARRAKTAQFLALRAKIVLRCAEGGTNREAAADLGVDESTVDRWRARFGSAPGRAA
jgi:FixJ family two-component response regulator